MQTSETPATLGILAPWVEVDTPALVVDERTMDQNIEEMAAIARGHGVRLRPHIKTHKTLEIAHRQLAAGATGIMCAKLGEAEVMAAGGIHLCGMQAERARSAGLLVRASR